MHHGAGLRTLLGDDEVVRALVRDPDGARLDRTDRAVVDYALKLTRSPGATTEADLAPLRQAGFDDRAILDIVQVTAYYNYVNRLADGLGVELEAHWDDDDMILSRTEMEARRATPPGDEP